MLTLKVSLPVVQLVDLTTTVQQRPEEAEPSLLVGGLIPGSVSHASLSMDNLRLQERAVDREEVDDASAGADRSRAARRAVGRLTMGLVRVNGWFECVLD